MISPLRNGGLLAAVLATTAVAGPIAVRESDPVGIPAIVSPIGLPDAQSITLGTYSLSATYEHDLLVQIGEIAGVSASASGAISIEAVDVRSWGSCIVSSTGVTKDDNLIGDVVSFFKDPTGLITKAFHADLRIDFEQVGGYYEFDIAATGAATVSIPIFVSEVAADIELGLEVYAGLVVSVDLVFSVSAAVELHGGFEYSFPEGAFVTVNPISGEIVDQKFANGVINEIPIVVYSGEATFEAALRVRVEAGTSIQLFGTGFNFEVGVYVDLVEYLAIIISNSDCPLSITEHAAVSVGAYALAVVDIDYQSFIAIPVVVHAALELDLAVLCLPGLAKPPALSTTIPSLPTSTDDSLTTSTAYTTTTYTITSCASTVIHCPTSLTSAVVVTSTKVLYTTVCPVTATGSPAPYVPSATPTNTPESIASPKPFSTVSVPVATTVYTPSVAVPTYTAPSSWAPVSSPSSWAPVSSPSGLPAPNAPSYTPTASAGFPVPSSGSNGTIPLPPTPTGSFSGAARSSGAVMSGLVVTLVGALALL